MKHLLLLLFTILCCVNATSLSANELVSNVKITSVEELIYTLDTQALVITYTGEDLRCLSRDEQKITFQADTVNEVTALNRISMTALTALETGTEVQIVGAIAGNCNSANGIILGSQPSGN